MGETAENVAEFENVTREEMDEFAALSQQRATASLENGFWEDEITPVDTVDDEGKPVTVTRDDGIRAGTTAEGLADLKPAFRPDGKVTAGNACPLNDGAAAVVVMSDTKAAELGLTPLARIVASGVTGLNPEIMGLGPIEASRQALARAGMTIDDIDLVEINEAFAAQVIPSAKHLGISLGQAQRQRRRHRHRPPVRHDRRPHHDHPRSTACATRRQDLRSRDDVRRRRPGHGDDRRAALVASIDGRGGRSGSAAPCGPNPCPARASRGPNPPTGSRGGAVVATTRRRARSARRSSACGWSVRSPSCSSRSS